MPRRPEYLLAGTLEQGVVDRDRQPWQFIAILSGRVPEQRKVPLTWENVGVEANILL
jgi:hypothetical protein